MLDEDLAVGIGEDDAGLVPSGVDGASGQRAADLELDAVQVDVALGLDRRLPVALAADTGWCGEVGIGRLGSGCLGNLGGVPGLLRSDPAGQTLMWALGVVDGVEGVDLGLEFGDRRGRGLLVEPAEQGLVETFVLALGGRLVGLASDRLDA